MEYKVERTLETKKLIEIGKSRRTVLKCIRRIKIMICIFYGETKRPSMSCLAYWPCKNSAFTLREMGTTDRIWAE